MASLPKSVADGLFMAVERVPATAWGATFLSPHPKAWDFRHVLQVEDNGHEKMVTFHPNEGPSEVTQLSEKIITLKNKNHENL